MLTQKEEWVKEILERFIVPALRTILEHENPLTFKNWQGNCCRQTGFVTIYFLKELLPEYDWTLWEGVFDDVVYGKPVHYEHAWVYGVNHMPKTQYVPRRLFVDLARIHQDTIFMETPGNRYPKDDPEYKDLKETYRTKMDYEEMFNDKEFYTKMTGRELIEKVKEVVNYEGLYNVYMAAFIHSEQIGLFDKKPEKIGSEPYDPSDEYLKPLI